MTREQAVEGIEIGIRLVKEKIDEGFNVFLSRGMEFLIPLLVPL